MRKNIFKRIRPIFYILLFAIVIIIVLKSGILNQKDTGISVIDNDNNNAANINSKFEVAKKSTLNINLLNKPKWYTRIKTVKNTNSLIVLVNKNNKLSKNYVPTMLKQIDGQYLKSVAYSKFIKLKKAAKKKGYTIIGVSGYRSYSAQKKNYNRIKNIYGFAYAEKYVARAGHSEHQTGLVMDVARRYNFGDLEDFDGSKEYKFVRKYAYKYGFIIRYTNENKKQTGYNAESWHLRFVGVKVAKIMKTKKYKSLEEYIFYEEPENFN